MFQSFFSYGYYHLSPRVYQSAACQPVKLYLKLIYVIQITRYQAQGQPTMPLTALMNDSEGPIGTFWLFHIKHGNIQKCTLTYTCVLKPL